MNPDSNFGDAAETTVTSRGDDRQVGAQTAPRVDLRRVLTGLRSKHEAATEVIGGRSSWGTERTACCTDASRDADAVSLRTGCPHEG